jgi:hypothetical protein
MSDEELRAAQAGLNDIKVSSGRRTAEGGAERQETRRPLLDEVSRAAENATVVHTDMGRGDGIKMQDGRAARGRGGFQTFGDGAELVETPDHFMKRFGPGNSFQTAEGNPPPGMVEAVSFPRAKEDVTATESYETKTGWLGRKTETHTRTVKTGEQDVMVLNPATGEEEPGVYFDYMYNPLLQGSKAEDQLGLPEYRELTGSRTGNSLVVRALLPESVAAELRAEIEQNPQAAREMAERLARERGGISQEVWEGQGNRNPARPPYEKLPAEHRLYMVDEPEFDGDHWKVRPLAS